MKKRSLLICLLPVLVLLASLPAQATYLDLSSWTDYAYDFSGGQPAGNWVLAADNYSVTQTINADPSTYLNGLSQSSYSMQGSFEVLTSSDNDFIGFIFGRQDASHFYLFDWKQGYQNEPGYGIGQEGFSVKKISAPSAGSLGLTDFWSSSGTAYSTILDSYFANDAGWADQTVYDFSLSFQSG